MIRRVFVLATLVTAAAFALSQDVTGDWVGPLASPMGELRFVLHITKEADGTLKGTMDSPDQAIAGTPLDSVTLEGSKLHFTLNIAKGNFVGSLKGNGSIAGTWTQASSQKMSLVFTRMTTPIKTEHESAPPSEIDGTWSGNVEGGEEGKLHFTFHIKNTADGLVVTTDCPEMHIQGWPATNVTRKGSTLKVEMKQVNGRFEGKLNKTLDAMNGGWMESDDPVRPITLKRVKQDSPQAPKQ